MTNKNFWLSGEVNQIKDILVKSRQLSYFRLAFASVVLVLFLPIINLGGLDIDPLAVISSTLSIILANSFGLYFFNKAKKENKKILTCINSFLIAVDIAALSCTVHFTRGLESDLFFLYLLPTLLASNVFAYKGVLITAIAAPSAYLAVVVCDNFHLLSYLSSSAYGQGLSAAYVQRLYGQIETRAGILFLVSIIWAGFCQRMSTIVQESSIRLKEQLNANTQLLEELKAKNEKEQMSNAISLALRQTLEPDQILSTACSRLGDALQGNVRCLLMVNPANNSDNSPIHWSSKLVWDSAQINKQEYKLIVNEKMRHFFLEHNWRRNSDETNSEDTTIKQKVIIFDEPFLDPEIANIAQELLSLSVSTILVRPIRYGAALKAVLCICAFENKRIWTLSELELIESVAGQIAIAVEHAGLVERLSETNRDLLLKNENLDAKNLELRQIQSQLIHQEKMASLGRIVAGIAHELNNPVNFVHGNLPYLKNYVEELKDLINSIDKVPDLPEKFKEIIAENKQKINYQFVVTDLENIIADLQEGTERIRQIIRNLRSFSRLDEAELKEASIQEGIESTIKILSQYYGSDKIPVLTKFSEIPAVLCYPGKLNQVWMNLLSNAAEALIDVKNPLVKISTSMDLESEQVLVEIEDNGPGIKPESQSKIFEPFYTTKPVGQGTGLGLSICHSIIERHGGHIWFESESESGCNKGTKFCVNIPLKAKYIDSAEVLLKNDSDLNPEPH